MSNCFIIAGFGIFIFKSHVFILIWFVILNVPPHPHTHTSRCWSSLKIYGTIQLRRWCWKITRWWSAPTIRPCSVPPVSPTTSTKRLSASGAWSPTSDPSNSWPWTPSGEAPLRCGYKVFFNFIFQSWFALNLPFCIPGIVLCLRNDRKRRWFCGRGSGPSLWLKMSFWRPTRTLLWPQNTVERRCPDMKPFCSRMRWFGCANREWWSLSWWIWIFLFSQMKTGDVYYRFEQAD